MEQAKICKNCGKPLIVKQTKRTAEQLQKSYYFTAYYFCPNCKKLFHDEKFKVVNGPDLFSNGVIPGKVKNENCVHIWTDGACTNNGYPNARAAWAFVVPSPPSLRPSASRLEPSGDCRAGSGVSGRGMTEKAGLVVGKQTNNTAEGLAIYHALLWAAEEKHKNVKIYSDSQITLNNLTKSSDRVKENRQIFELIEDVIAANGLTVDYEKVPAHADNVNNNRADKLANTLAGIK